MVQIAIAKASLPLVDVSFQNASSQDISGRQLGKSRLCSECHSWYIIDGCIKLPGIGMATYVVNPLFKST